MNKCKHCGEVVVLADYSEYPEAKWMTPYVYENGRHLGADINCPENLADLTEAVQLAGFHEVQHS